MAGDAAEYAVEVVGGTTDYSTNQFESRYLVFAYLLLVYRCHVAYQYESESTCRLRPESQGLPAVGAKGISLHFIWPVEIDEQWDVVRL